MPRTPSTKLSVPALPRHAIDRPRLLEQLRRAVQDPVTVVVSPPGSGKSVLLGQWWAEVEPRGAPAVAWVMADGADEDAVRFGRHLVAALAAVWGSGAEALGELLETGGERLGPSFLAALVEEASGRPDTVIVVDDAHALAVAVTEELGWLGAHAPPALHLVVTSRTDPAMGLHRLALAGRLTTIDQDVLAFDVDETKALVEHVARRRLTEHQAATLQERTEGWAAAIQLAALALRDRHDEEVHAYLATFSGQDRGIADYLTEEVVSRLPLEVRTFLERTAVLDRLCASLCDELTGTTGGQRALEDLEHRHLFLQPLDDRREWFRYHHLFADLLRYQLRATDPDLEVELLRTAAAWHLARDELAEGAEYLLRARAWDDVLELAVAQGWRLYERGEATTAIRWLSRVPDPVRASHLSASIVLAVLHRMVGNAFKVDALLDDLERRAPDDRVRVAVDMIRAAGIQWNQPPEDALARARRVVDWLGGRADAPQDHWLLPNAPDAFVATYAQVSGGRALTDLGRPEEARAWFAVGRDGPDTYPPWRIHLLGAQAVLEAGCGCLERARAYGDQALGMADESGFADHTCGADAHLGVGQVALDRYDLHRATALLAGARERARRNRRTNLLASILIQEARLQLALGQPEEGLALLAAHRRAGAPFPPDRIAAGLAAVEAHLLMATGAVGDAEVVVGRAPVVTADAAVVLGQVAVARADHAGVDAVLEAWPEPWTVRSELQRLLVRAAACDVADDPAGADAAVRAALRMAAPDGHVAVFVEGGGRVHRLLRQRALTRPGHHVEALVRHLPELGPAEPGTALSPRELAVLRYLATRLDNAEISARLYVSANTLKTHMRRIYRKLGVQTREQAVRRGEELGLL